MKFSEKINQKLLKWFYKNKRDLPFRREKNPYQIWISEIMAQQTQIDTLLPYYESFIAAFPDVRALAAAEEDEVLKHWEGLGYYSRAKNLHRAAKIIVNDFDGKFPDNYDDIVKLPGVGPYTAGAVASIAFKQAVPAVDGNVMRVITRLADDDIDISSSTAKKSIGKIVKDLMSEDEPGDFNEALMELGALVCTPKSPSCLICPWREDCLARKNGTVDARPVKTKHLRSKPVDVEVVVMRNASGKIYIEKRPEKGLLAGLWGLPVVKAEGEAGLAASNYAAAHFPGNYIQKRIGSAKHVFSHRTWKMEIYMFIPKNPTAAESSEPYLGTFADFSELRDVYALPTAFSKLLPMIEKEK